MAYLQFNQYYSKKDTCNDIHTHVENIFYGTATPP